MIIGWFRIINTFLINANIKVRPSKKKKRGEGMNALTLDQVEEALEMNAKLRKYVTEEMERIRDLVELNNKRMEMLQPLLVSKVARARQSTFDIEINRVV